MNYRNPETLYQFKFYIIAYRFLLAKTPRNEARSDEFHDIFAFEQICLKNDKFCHFVNILDFVIQTE